MVVEHINQVELSRRWRLSPRTLERWRYRGTGPQYLKVGARILYRVADIEAFEAEQLRESPRSVRRSRRRCRSARAGSGPPGMSIVPLAMPKRARVQTAADDRDRALRLGRAGRARRGPRVPPRLPRARPHRLRPLSPTPRRAPRSACSAAAPTTSPSAASSTSCSIGTGPRTTATSRSPGLARKGALPDFASHIITEEAA